MIWPRFSNSSYPSDSNVSKLLEKPDVSLEELLDEPEIIQEVQSSNAELTEYLRQPDVLYQLINLIVEDDIYQKQEQELEQEQNTALEAKIQREQEIIFEKESAEIEKQNGNQDHGQESEAKNGVEIHNDNDQSTSTSNIANNNANANANTNATTTSATTNNNNNTTNNTTNTTTNVTFIDDEKHDNETNDNDTKADKENQETPENEDSHTGNGEISSDLESDSSDASAVYDESYNSDMNIDDDDDDEREETFAEAHCRRAQVAVQLIEESDWSVAEAFMEHLELLEKLWTILDKDSSLSILSASHFTRINDYLLVKKTDEMIQFILSQPSLVDRFMRHIDNPTLMDLLLKVIVSDKPDTSTGAIDVLQEQKLIPSLIAFLGPEYPSTIQSASADFLKAFITISANSNNDDNTIGPNELTRELVSEPVIRELVRLMLYGGTGLANAVGIIIEIIRKNNSDYDFVPVLFITIKSHPPTSRDPIYLGTLVKVFAENIPNFTKMLEKPHPEVLETPFGSIEPLGFERFKICELVAELLHCSNMGLLNDEKGEAIVKERDIERTRLKNLDKTAFKFNQQISTSPENSVCDEDISRDINNLDISSDRNGNTDNIVNDQLPADQSFDATQEQEQHSPIEGEEREGVNEVLEHGEQEELPEQQVREKTDEADYSIDMDEGHLADHSNESEAMLRQNTVVGDQLKIALADNNVIITILNMFFRFPWNNFLHNVVFDIVQQILNGSMEIGYNKYLAIDLFGRGNITKLIIEGQKKCEDYEEQTGLRLGYMGHLTLIAEEVVKFTSLYQPESISFIIHDTVSNDEWVQYVNETLVDTRKKYNAILGGTLGEDDELQDTSQGMILDPNVDNDLRGSGYQDDDDDDEDYHSLDNSQNLNAMHNGGGNNANTGASDSDDDNDQFSRYMSQQMTNDLPDKFGSSDEDDEDDEPVNWSMSTDFTSKLNSNANNPNSIVHYQPPNELNMDSGNNINDDNLDNSADFDQDAFKIGGDDDDYEDPNDDGRSYARKNHPLYSTNGLLSPIELQENHNEYNDIHDSYSERNESGKAQDEGEKHRKINTRHRATGSSALEDEYNTDALSDEDSDDNQNNDDDLYGDEDDLGLMRTTSKGDMSWDDDEQRRLMTVANYIHNSHNTVSHGN